MTITDATATRLAANWVLGADASRNLGADLNHFDHFALGHIRLIVNCGPNATGRAGAIDALPERARSSTEDEILKHSRPSYLGDYVRCAIIDELDNVEAADLLIDVLETVEQIVKFVRFIGHCVNYQISDGIELVINEETAEIWAVIPTSPWHATEPERHLILDLDTNEIRSQDDV